MILDRMAELEQLVKILKKSNALYLLKRVADEGYTSFSAEDMELMEKLLDVEDHHVR